MKNKLVNMLVTFVSDENWKALSIGLIKLKIKFKIKADIYIYI